MVVGAGVENEALALYWNFLSLHLLYHHNSYAINTCIQEKKFFLGAKVELLRASVSHCILLLPPLYPPVSPCILLYPTVSQHCIPLYPNTVSHHCIPLYPTLPPPTTVSHPEQHATKLILGGEGFFDCPSVASKITDSHEERAHNPSVRRNRSQGRSS